MTIEKVGVVGCGLMGSGIAEVSARAGFHVRVREVDEAALERGRARIERSLARAVEKEKATAEERDAALDRIAYTTDLKEMVDRDLVVEAIVEELEAKEALFRELDGICPPSTIYASNTSSLTVTDMAAATDRPDRFVGLHFFNPVPVMRLVEVVRTLATSEETAEAAFEFARRLGKEPIAARDTSGFVVNLLLVPYMLDAVRQLERGVATVEAIDAAMTLGAGHPMGPFTLCDFVGLDTTYRIAEIMYDEYREARYAPPPLLKRMVTLGRYGRKSGRGFYDYSGETPVPLPVV
ncbi:MAG TPA: 3-hydroxybutyryl-CoA dehydrogenase [Longimicrobiales bacterium]|nr:3-hydroxybutyryl-CoA dehydrogenase [Longimicrobiales bacterium]